LRAHQKTSDSQRKNNLHANSFCRRRPQRSRCSLWRATRKQRQSVRYYDRPREPLCFSQKQENAVSRDMPDH
jgi:hypothetical protein